MKVDIHNKYTVCLPHLHDYHLSGYSYEYSERQLKIFIDDNICIHFNTTLWMSAEGCGFWGSEESIHYLSYAEDTYLKHLIGRYKEEGGAAYFDEEDEYLCLELLTHGGDLIHIICESVEWEAALEDGFNYNDYLKIIEKK